MYHNNEEPRIVDEGEFQRICGQFVSDHVYICQSYLVDAMLRENVFEYEDIENMQYYEYEIDGEVFESGYEEWDAHIGMLKERLTEAIDARDDYDGEDQDIIDRLGKAIDVLDTQISELRDLEPTDNEIFEWWVVSDYLEHKLKGMGHPFMDNDYGTWWGRCTTGQAILLDGAIRTIVTEFTNTKSNNKY